MDRFEQSFENLDVQSQVMEGTMCNTSTLTTPQNEVDSLMQQVADEAGYVCIFMLNFKSLPTLFAHIFQLHKSSYIVQIWFYTQSLPLET